MHTPAAVAWAQSGVTGAVGLYYLARLVRQVGSSREQRQLEASQALMGLGMALMALPPPLGGQLVGRPAMAAFGAAAAWSMATALRRPSWRSHHLHHAVCHLAMVDMVWTAARPMPADMAPQGVPWLTGVLLLFFGTSVLVAGAQLVSASATSLPCAVRSALGLGMFTMLLTM